MDLKPALKKLESSKYFMDWQRENKSTYFSYAFKIKEEMGKDDWQLGFYNKKKDKITTFVMNSGTISIRPEEEIFKTEGTEVNEIKLEKVKIAFDDAIAKASEFQQKNFPKDRSTKTIAILQDVENLGAIWNITYITELFNTLNIKINAGNGMVVEHSLSSIFDFRKE